MLLAASPHLGPLADPAHLPLPLIMSGVNGNDGIWSQPLLLSVMAGASTCIGAAVPLVRPKSSPLRKAHLAAALSLAGSVMMTVSFFSLLPEALEGPQSGLLFDLTPWTMFQRLASFLVGGGIYWTLSKCAFPEPEDILGFQEREEMEQNGKESVPLIEMKPSLSKGASLRIRTQASGLSKDDETAFGSPTDNENNAGNDVENITGSIKPGAGTKSNTPWWASYSSGRDLASADARRAWRVTLLLFISLAVHNFPEGLAVAASSLHSQKLGLTTAVAIGLHNIPEGIAISIPCLAARPDSPLLAFGLASLSGLTEPMGALVALTVLQVDQKSMGNWLAFTASIMISVAVWELFPEAWRNAMLDNGKSAFWVGTALGFVIMVGSEAILNESMAPSL